MHRVTIQYAAPADTASFDQRYREEHVPIAARLPGLRKVTLSHPRAMQGDAPYLVAELWFEDADALKTALKSQEMAETGKHAAGLGAEMTFFTGEVEEIQV
jgi:uncharacterized protein (TIGR02118 family)